MADLPIMENTAMTPLEFTLINLGLSFFAGIIGALLGIGGGRIIVPALTLLLGIDIRYAIRFTSADKKLLGFGILAKGRSP